MNYGRRFMTLYRKYESRSSPGKRNAKKQKRSEEALQIAVKRIEVKRKKKRKDIPFEYRVPKNSKER